MIARKNRFRGHGSLKFVYQKGRVTRGQFCMIKSCVNPRRTIYRAAVVVSRKVHKSAVVRNRIRRRIYEVIRQATITKNVDIVCVVFDERLATVPADELSDLITGLLKKADII